MYGLTDSVNLEIVDRVIHRIPSTRDLQYLYTYWRVEEVEGVGGVYSFAHVIKRTVSK